MAGRRNKHKTSYDEKPTNQLKLRSGQPYWAELLAPAQTYPALAADQRCDVVVLGGGITGALVSHQLTESGVDTILLDRGEFARSSTVASTGLLQYEVDVPLIDLISKVGEEHAVHAYRRGLTAIDEIEELVSKLDDPCGFSRRESLYFASSMWHYRSLHREFECRRKHGFRVDFLSRKQLTEISSIQAAGAIRSYGDAQIDPYRFALALINRGTTLGLRAFANTPIDDVRESDTGVTIKSGDRVVQAKVIVYATGYTASDFLPKSKGNLDSTYAVISGPNLQIDGWPNECLIWETARPYFYARRTDDGRALIGGEDTEFATDHDRDALVERKIERLVARFQQLFPKTEFIPHYAWAGTFASTKDGLAYIGQPKNRPRAYFALGYGGNGITYSVIASKLIADLYLKRASLDADVFRFDR